MDFPCTTSARNSLFGEFLILLLLHLYIFVIRIRGYA